MLFKRCLDFDPFLVISLSGQADMAIFMAQIEFSHVRWEIQN